MKKIFIVFFALIFTCNLFATGWEKPEKITVRAGKNKYPAVAVNSNTIAVTWIEYKRRNAILKLRLKSDKKWQKVLKLARFPTYKPIKPSIVFFKNHLVVGTGDDNENIKIFYSPLNAQMLSFNSVTVISNNYINLLPVLKVIDNRLYLFYQENIENKKFKIKYCYTEDLINWSEPESAVEYIKKEIGSFFPLILNTKENIFLFYLDRFPRGKLRNDVLFVKKYNFDTRRWSKAKQISPSKFHTEFVSGFIHNNKIYLASVTSVFTNYNYLSFFTFYKLNPETLTVEDKKEQNFKFQEYYSPLFQFFKDKFHLLWYSYKTRKSDIYFSISEDLKKWSKPEKISKKGKYKRHFKAAITKKEFYIVYENEITRKNIRIELTRKDVFCAPPLVYSPTHKNRKWSYYNNVTIKWNKVKDTSGIKGYAFIFDRYEKTEPDIINIEPDITVKEFKNLPDGKYYFHIRAIDNADNWSKTSHYGIYINTSPPEAPVIVSPTHKEFLASDNDSPEFSWYLPSGREVKGYSYVLSQNEELIPAYKITTKKTNIKFKHLAEGVWYFRVRACDPLGRWGDYSTFTFTIQKILIASKIEEKVKTRYSYTVKTNDVLSYIIKRVLKIGVKGEANEYVLPLREFNLLENPDFLRPGDIVMFPAIIAKPGDTKEKLSRMVFGSPMYKKKIVILDREDGEIEPGDLLSIREKHFLKTGKLKKIKTQKMYKEKVK